jgi:DNA-binding SARP family transcriptional activator
VIHCRTLGPVTIDIDGQPPPAQLLWRKHLALLIYLARSARRTRAREHLVGLLWPEKDERAARHSLNEALRVLRRALGGAAIDTSAGQIRLAPGDPALDIDELERLAGARAWSDAAALIGGEFMEGFGLPGASAFEDWLTAQRAHWRSRSVDALLAWADDLERSGRARDAVEPAERALALDPASDRVIRAVMRTRSLCGDRSIALARYAAFLEQLGTSGAVTDAETERVADRIRRERGQPPRPGDGPDIAAARRVPLVGRGAELARLVELVQASAGGSRAVLAIVEGEPGTGRSRLVEEVAARARLDGAVVATVRGVPADRTDPHGGVIALARGGLLEGRGVTAAPAPALATFAREIGEWSDRFPAVRALAPATLVTAFIEVLRACLGEQPTILAVDDAQHLDDDSVLALGRALRDLSTQPLVVLLSVPPRSPVAPLEELRSRVGRDLTGGVVRLGPLDDAALTALVRWAFPSYDGAASERLVRRLASDSAGLPLLAVELLYAVAQGLDLGAVAGTWPSPLRTLSETLPGELPDAVRAAVRVGFRRLSAAAQRVLAALALLEDRVAPDRLARATELSIRVVHDALDELEWARWVSADPRGYAFIARIVRDVVAVDMTTAGQRQRIIDRTGRLGS